MNPSVLRGPVFLLVTSLLLIIAPASHGQTPPTQVPPLDVATNAPPSAPAAAPQPAGVTPAPSAGSTANATPVSSGDIKVINGPGDLSPTTKPFVHPGIYYTASDLAFMRKKLADKAEPWTSAWEKNKPTASDDSWTPHAVAEWDCNAGGGPTTNGFYLFGDPMVAHREALAWAMTGSQANADVAIKILNAWASTLQSIKTFSMPQQKLATGACFAQLCNAAELLVYGGPDGKSSGWSNDDIQKFKTMLQIPYGAMKGFMPGFNGNWDLIMTDSMMSMAVFSDDHNMFDEALQHYIVGTTPNGGLPNYVYEELSRRGPRAVGPRQCGGRLPDRMEPGHRHL